MLERMFHVVFFFPLFDKVVNIYLCAHSSCITPKRLSANLSFPVVGIGIFDCVFLFF